MTYKTLHLREFLLLSMKIDSTYTYSQIKSLLPADRVVSDSTLKRILINMIECSFVEKKEN